MKALKTLFFTALVLTLVGAAIYLPLRYHVVTFQSKTHLISKDKLGYNDTLLNLDQQKEKWKKVLQSPKLREYFSQHYARELEKRIRTSSNKLWKKLRVQGRKTWKLFKKKAREVSNKALKELSKD